MKPTFQVLEMIKNKICVRPGARHLLPACFEYLL